MKKILAFFLILMLILTGCGKKSSEEDHNNSSGTDTSAAPVEVDFAKSDADMFTDRDYKTDYDESTAVTIQLNGDSATSSSNAVKISGSTITICKEATYIISGTLNNGMIIVDAKDTAKLQLVLNGVAITSKTSAPLYILEADKVFVTLAPNSTNTLANGGTFTAIDDNNIDAAIFSKQDLTLNGSGSLTVTSPAGHGIVSKDDLVFTSGTYNIASASHGLDANDSVRISNASITVDAGKDGLHAENSDDTSLGFVYISSGTLNIEAEGDGISAEVFMQLVNGTYNIISGGGSKNGAKQSSDSWGGFMGGVPGGRPGRPGEMQSQSSSSNSASSDSADSSTSIKGLKASGDMLISNGTFAIDSADDAIHSNASIVINGGTYEIASGDDGVHADEELTITAGNMNITECYEGLEALHIKVSGGDMKLVASDDGLNAAGGTDSSGYGGTRGNDQFGGGHGGMGGGMPGGMGGSSSSNGSIVVSGGNLYINSSGDGMDANGTLKISGGYTVVVGPTQGDTATLDYDKSATITGGTFIGTGASGMAQTFSDSKQGVVAVSVGNQSAGTQITLKDSNGNTLITHEPELSFAVVILSSPDIRKGETYEIHVGSTSGTFEAN